MSKGLSRSHLDKINDERMGRILRRIRTKHKVSQDQLALNIGRHRSWVGHLEMGRTLITEAKCIEYLAGLGVVFDKVPDGEAVGGVTDNPP